MNASYPSYIAFSWFTGFAWTGFKRALTFEDLHDLPPSIKSCNVVPPFLRNFFVRKNRFETDSVKLNGAGEDIKIVKSSNETQTSGVFRSILKTYGMNFLAAMVLKLIVDVLTFIPPIFLKKIIGYVASSDEELWKGIVYAVGMLIVSCSQAILMANHSWRMYQIGFWLRSSLISTIYRKSLTISPQGKKDSTVGEVVNLMSVDVEKLFQLMVSKVI